MFRSEGALHGCSAAQVGDPELHGPTNAHNYDNPDAFCLLPITVTGPGSA